MKSVRNDSMAGAGVPRGASAPSARLYACRAPVVAWAAAAVLWWSRAKGTRRLSSRAVVAARRTRRPATFFCLAVVGTSCADSAPPEAPVATVNVEGAPPWSVETSFELEQDQDDPLGKVSGAVFASPDVIAVADGLNSRVVLADSSGRLLRSVGRAGRGPLEFSRLRNLSRWPGDSVFVWDFGTRRYSVFSPSTSEGRTVLPQGMETPVARVLPGADGGLGGLWVTGVILGTPADHKRRGRYRLYHDIGYWEGAGPVKKTMSLAGPAFVGSRQWVGGPRTVMAAGNGQFFFTEGERPAVTVLEPSGVVRREIAVRGMAVELTDALRQEHRESLYESGYSVEFVDKVLGDAPLPERIDAIGQIVFDRAGTLWLGQRWVAGVDQRIWLNVTTEGVPIRRVAMSAGSGTMLDAAGDRLLFLWRDAMDLDHIAVHVIAGPTSQ